MNQETYAASGVQVRKAEAFVERIKRAARRPAHQKMWPAAGGYACVYPLTDEQAVAVTTDGVGTKLLVAHELKKFDTVGIDLVAMCANDLICVGATPALFLDYLAVGRLDDEVCDQIIEGIIKGCDLSGMILSGGETAEMPGVYAPDHFDLAGFAAGNLSRSRLITGEAIKPGQKLLAVESTGIHSNGLSLARKVLDKDQWPELLKPTAIYAAAVGNILQDFGSAVTGIAHITGGGWRNLLRLNSAVGYYIDKPLPVPPIFNRIAESVAPVEMYKTFNMGMGLALIAEEHDSSMIDRFKLCGFHAAFVGEVTDRAGIVELKGFDFVLQDKLKD